MHFLVEIKEKSPENLIFIIDKASERRVFFSTLMFESIEFPNVVYSFAYLCIGKQYATI